LIAFNQLTEKFIGIGDLHGIVVGVQNTERVPEFLQRPDQAYGLGISAEQVSVVCHHLSGTCLLQGVALGNGNVKREVRLSFEFVNVHATIIQ